QSSAVHAPVTTTRGKSYNAEAAANSAAALLAAGGGGPLTSGGPGSSAVGGPIRLVKNSIGMTFVRVPPGIFRMGDDTSGRSFEGPVHEVKITRPFYISVVPVTQGQYEAVKGKNP